MFVLDLLAYFNNLKKGNKYMGRESYAYWRIGEMTRVINKYKLN